MEIQNRAGLEVRIREVEGVKLAVSAVNKESTRRRGRVCVLVVTIKKLSMEVFRAKK